MLRRVVFIGIALLGLGVGVTGASEKILVDRIVAVVGNSTILYSELEDVSRQIVEQRREYGYTSDRDPINEALETMMLQKLLYTQAQLDSLKLNDGAILGSVEEQVAEMVRKMGSTSAVEAYYHKPMFEVRSDLRQKMEEQSLAGDMEREIKGKVRITPGEVEKFFRSIPKDSLPIVPEQYVYAQITKFPPSMQEAKQRARERLMSLRERILKGESFGMLARMYSVDPSSAIRGGEMDFMPKDGLVAPFADAMVKLKKGQVSEVVETEFGFHIIELLEKQGNLYRARHILIKPTFTTEELVATDKYLDSLAVKIRAGELTFEEAALKNSDDKYSKNNGGLVSNQEMMEMYNHFDATATQTKFRKEQLYGDAKVLTSLKVGEVSDAYQTQTMRGDVQSKIVKLLKIIPAHSAGMKEDYLELEAMALDDKKQREFDVWLKKKIDSTYIRIDEDFRGGEFANKAWLK